MTPADITWIQVENTTKCNAWCPGCARNIDGYELIPNLVLEDLDIKRFEEVLMLYPNLHTVQFCGTYGDFAAAKNAIDHVELALRFAKKIQIHTHGALRNTEWWKQLAEVLRSVEHDVWFAVDGLKGTHEIYRQGTSFDKAMANASAFIANEGHATWQFIPWQHNEHQIKDCLALSQKMGFKKFRIVKSVRYNFTGKHYKTGQPVEFIAWSQDNVYNKRNIPIKNQVLEKDCMHLSLPSVYLNANGKISSCCEFNTSLSFDDFSMLPNIKQELTNSARPTCLRACGSYATLTL